MPKADLPQTSTYITKYNRLVQLYLQASKSGAEITELAGLQTELADYQIRASDYNLLNDNVTTLLTKVAEAATVPATLKHGLNTINTSQASGAELTASGRTLVNIIGKDGNGESLTPFSTSGTVALSTTQKKSGSNSVKTTDASTGYKDYAYLLDTTKQYILAGWVYIESYTSGTVSISLRDVGTNTTRYTASANTATVGSWQFVYVKVPTSHTLVGTGFRVLFGGISAVAVAYFDDIRLYEISSADATAIGTTYTATTTPSIDDFIPYVDSVQHSQGVAVRKTGKNILPPFTQWTLHANAVVTEPYKLTLNATAADQYSTWLFNALPSQAYVLSMTENKASTVYVLARELDATGATIVDRSISNGANNVAFTTNANTKQIKVFFGNTTSGTYTITNPQLELGTVKSDFVEYNADYAYIPTILASNVDRSVVDTYNSALGTITRRYKTGVLLDGSSTLGWLFGADYSGYKRIKATLPASGVVGKGNVTKYDGKMLINDSSATFSTSDSFHVGSSDTNVHILASDADTGWGETYTPSVGEIQAYMLGYKLNNGTFGTPYNGSGTKTWTLWNATDNTGSVTTVPTTLATGFTPYKLDYQLATSVEETLTGDVGAISLHNGGNQLELLEGVVPREKVVPYNDVANSVWRINSLPNSTSWLKSRPSEIIAIYKNGVIDKKWTIRYNVTYSRGLFDAFISANDYDTTADYYATYVVLDKYLYTANAITATATYQSTLGATVAKNAQDIADIKTVNGAQSFAIDYAEAKADNLRADLDAATSAATANSLVKRDANSQINLGTPTASTHAATKTYVDTTTEAARPFVRGTYTGDGTASRTISLAFTPSAVLVVAKNGDTLSAGSNMYGGLAVTGSDVNDGIVTALAVTTNGFIVYYNSGDARRTNQNTAVYHYIAFK